MGGVVKSLFGGSKQKSSSSSSNQAYPELSAAFSPLYGQAQAGANGLAALLGGDASGLNRFKSMTGFDNAMLEGSRGITGNAAAAGLLRSGSTAKGLTSFGANLNNQYANNYMDRLLGQANLGLQAGNTVSGAGATSTSTTSGSSSTGGLGKFLGAGLSVLSDIRTKEGIKKIGELDNGLNVYTFRYKNEPEEFTGVMAQEVQKIQPEALGPTTEDGFMTVDYSKIKGLEAYG